MSFESDATLRDLYDVHIRRNTTPDHSGANVDVGPTFVRWTASNGLGWSEVFWTSLNESNADQAIADQVEFYRSRNLSFVWGVYDYDLPTDLGLRLVNAGFIESNSSTVMVAETSTIARPSKLPAGTKLVRVSDEAGVNSLIGVHESVFGHDHQELRRSILRRLDVAPDEMVSFVVTADGRPVSSSRIEFLAASQFAALWGGSTEPAWRGKGIYRAQVFRRAQLAAERGYRYLMVLTSEDSRPILSGLGFNAIARVTRYSWNSSDDDRSS